MGLLSANRMLLLLDSGVKEPENSISTPCMHVQYRVKQLVLFFVSDKICTFTGLSYTQQYYNKVMHVYLIETKSGSIFHISSSFLLNIGTVHHFQYGTQLDMLETRYMWTLECVYSKVYWSIHVHLQKPQLIVVDN